VENPYAIYFDLNALLRYAYLWWFILFVVWTWRFWRKPLHRVFAWTMVITLFSILDATIAWLLPLSLSTTVEKIAGEMVVFPLALLALLSIRRMWRPWKSAADATFKVLAMIVLLIVLGGLVFIGTVPWLVGSILGHRYNLGDPRDAQKLRLFAYEAEPLIDALGRYKHDHGNFPKEVGELSPRYLDRKYLWSPDDKTLEFGHDFLSTFHYNAGFSDGLSYSLERKMNWSESLRYTCGVKGRNRWYYYPDDEASIVYLPVPMDAK